MVKTMKGTRDFYPEEYGKLSYVLNTWKKVCHSYGFMQYDGPVVESVELWEKKGEISDQMFILENRSDKSKPFTIRPEMTPTLARMIASRPELKKPIKLFSTPICMRYERPQKGRLREFYQLNVDSLFENPDEFLEAEILKLLIDLLKEFGLTSKDFYIRLSHRGFLDSFLKKYENKDEIVALIDKFDKIGEENFKLSLGDLGLENKEIDSILNFIKNDNYESLESVNPEAFKEFSSIFDVIEEDYLEYIKFDPTIVRGLSYYTGIIFEAFDKTKKFRAIAGGGRYDNLVSEYGKQKVMGIGFGMGDVVLQEFLKDKGLLKSDETFDYYAVSISKDKSVLTYLNKVVNSLRNQEKTVFNAFYGKSTGKEAKKADEMGCSYLVVVGEEEMKNSSFTVKNLKTREQETINLN